MSFGSPCGYFRPIASGTPQSDCVPLNSGKGAVQFRLRGDKTCKGSVTASVNGTNSLALYQDSFHRNQCLFTVRATSKGMFSNA